MAAPGIPAIAALAAAGGAIAAGVTALVRGGARARTEDVRFAAERLGWTFRGEVPFATLPELDRFELFRPGHGKRVRNAMTSPAGGASIVLFDYRYVTGAGNSRRSHRQTACYIVDDALALPSFSLRPETFVHRVSGLFGYQDIDLPSRPEFSRLFLLRGEDEAAIRALFDGEVAAFFEARPGVCAAGVGRELLFWRPRGFAPPREIPALVEDCVALAKRLAPDPDGA
jgi:hypothetical protein